MKKIVAEAAGETGDQTEGKPDGEVERDDRPDRARRGLRAIDNGDFVIADAPRYADFLVTLQ